MRRRPYRSGRHPLSGQERKETSVSEPQAADEMPKVEVEVEEATPAAGVTFGDPRSVVLDDDWNDD